MYSVINRKKIRITIYNLLLLNEKTKTKHKHTLRALVSAVCRLGVTG